MTGIATYDPAIGEGGLLRRFEAACHLTTLRWQLVAMLLLTWLPIMGFALAHEYVTGNTVALVHYPAIHVRLLVASPVLLLLDRIFPTACNLVLLQLSGHGFIADAARARYERTVRSGKRMSNSSAPELILALACLGVGVAALIGIFPVAGLGSRDRITLAHVWYALTALPLFEFLLLRSLWRWIIWLRVLIGLARIELDLDPTHPDYHGGIGFLRDPSLSYCVCLLFTIASVLCAEWGARTTTNATFTTFLAPLLAFAVIGMLLAFGPLLLFIPQLVRARREGRFALGGAAADAGRLIRRMWLDGKGVLSSPELQGLESLAVTYRETTDKISYLLFGKRDLILVVVATLSPMVPLMLWKIPHEDLLAMVKMVTRAVP